MPCLQFIPLTIRPQVSWTILIGLEALVAVLLTLLLQFDLLAAGFLGQCLVLLNLYACKQPARQQSLVHMHPSARHDMHIYC